MAVEYGQCPCSGSRYEHRLVQVRMTVNDQLIVLNDVPQGACPVCGARVYKADVLGMIEALMIGDTEYRHVNFIDL